MCVCVKDSLYVCDGEKECVFARETNIVSVSLFCERDCVLAREILCVCTCVFERERGRETVCA